MPDRRSFLRLLGAAMGSAVLSGCGGGGSSGSGGAGTVNPSSTSAATASTSGTPAPTPNGFNITPVISSGSSLPGGLAVDSNLTGGPPTIPAKRPSSNSVKSLVEGITTRGGNNTRMKRTVTSPFTGHIWVTDTSQLVYTVRDSQGQLGLYISDITAANPPTLTNTQKIVRVGDTLDGATVAMFTTCDVNFYTASVAFRVQRSDKTDAIYVYNKNGTIKRVVGTHQRLPSVLLRGTTTGSLPASVSIHGDNDDMLMVLFLTDVKKLRHTTQCLVYMPASDAGQAQVLLASDDILPDTGHALIRTLTSPLLHDSGTFIVMGTATPPGFSAVITSVDTSTTSARPTFILSGSVVAGAAPTFRLLSADSSLDVTSSRVNDGQYRSGRHVALPRLGPNGKTAILVYEAADDSTTLLVGSDSVITAVPSGSGASLSPLGFPVIGLRSPVFSPDGYLLVYVRTTKTTELVLYNNGTLTTLLAGAGGSGFAADQINGKTVAGVTFGYTARMIDANGAFAARLRFTDDTSVIVVARPV